MKRRARRAVIGAAALVVVLLLAALVVANWSTIRDHIEAWHFQLTRETTAIDPERNPSLDCARLKGSESSQGRSFALQGVFGVLTCSGYSVIHDLPERALHERWVTWPPLPKDPDDIRNFFAGSSWSIVITATDELAIRILRASGYRVLEQRFPRRAW